MEEIGNERWKTFCEDKLRTAKKESDLVSNGACFKAMTESKHFVDIIDQVMKSCKLTKEQYSEEVSFNYDKRV